MNSNEEREKKKADDELKKELKNELKNELKKELKKEPKKNKKFKLAFPDTYVLVFGLIILAALMSYIIPAGSYTRTADPVTGNLMVQPGTFENVAQSPVSITDVFMAIPSGMLKNAITVFFIFMIGGAFGIINSTGSIHALITKVISGSKSTKSREKIIAVLVVVFGLGGSVIGMAEECFAFLPMLIMLAIGLGYDAIVGTAIMMIGVAAGYGAATLNPFTVGLAQGIAGIPLYSGTWFRCIFFAVTFTGIVIYIIRYCRMITADPTKSLVADIDYSSFTIDEAAEQLKLTKRHILVLIIFFGGILLLMGLIVFYSLGMKELTAYFFALGIAGGIAYGLTPNKIAEGFVNGMKDMVYPAILVGIASGISVILEQGMILDSIVNACSALLQYTPRWLNGGIMMLIQSAINFFIPSGTGQAIVTMPLMAPLADVVGIPRQVAVLAYQMGDGFTNTIVPTLGLLMGSIAIGKIPYTRWFRFVSKWLCFQVVINFIFLIIAVQINLQ